MRSLGIAFVLRSGIVLSMLICLSLLPTRAQVRQDPPLQGFPIVENLSEFSTLPMPPLPPEVIIPAGPPILNPEVKARYYINVADYGAQTGLAFDNTAAIQAALNAACNPAFTNVYYAARPILFFPPGLFQIYQTQLPSTNSPLIVTCTVEIEGSGYTTGAQFSVLAPGSWIYVNPGPQPNAAAAITFTSEVNPIIRSILIAGVNQAVAVYNVTPSLFENVCLSALTTGMPDNTPLKVTDSFWFWYKGGCLQTYSVDVPVAIFTAEELPNIPDARRLDGLVYLSDLITTAGGFKYIQRAPQNGPLAGNFVFRNITMEQAPDVLEISQTCTGCAGWRMSSLTFDNVATADSNCATCSVLNMNAPDLVLSGVLIHHSYAGQGAGRAITVNSGLLEDHYVDFCAYTCSNAVLDANGDPVWNYSGEVKLSGGTTTLQFAPVAFYGNPPVCIPNDETSINGAKITTTVFSMTITGGMSDVVDYACFFNNPLPIP